MSERGTMRRRLHEQLRAREALLLDLGALVYELHRQGKRAPALLQRKAAQLTTVDNEVRELQAALEGAGELPVAQPETTEVDALPEEEPQPEEEPPEEEPPEEEPPEEDPHEEDPHEETDEETALAEHEEPRA